MDIFPELFEELPFVHVPVSVSESLSHLLWESVEALDIIRITVEKDHIVRIERWDESIIREVVSSIGRWYAIHPPLLNPRMPASSWVRRTEEIRRYAFFRGTEGPDERIELFLGPVSQFLDSYEVVFDTLVSEDIGHILTIPEFYRGSIPESDDVVFPVVLKGTQWNFTLHWVQKVFLHFGECTAEYESIDYSRCCLSECF